MESSNIKMYIAEAIGTAVLTLIGCGTAVYTSGTSAFGVATPLAFGLSVVAMAYCIGRISGCHINPAITIGMLIDGRMDKKDAVFYIVAQFVGAIVGALLLWFFITQTGAEVTGLGCNAYQSDDNPGGIKVFGAIVIEIVLTMIFVLAALGVTSTKATAAQGGIVIGLALTLVHLLGLYFTGTSVNPARSFGPALVMVFVGETLAISQVWVFILAPVVGAVIAGFLWKYLKPASEE